MLKNINKLFTGRIELQLFSGTMLMCQTVIIDGVKIFGMSLIKGLNGCIYLHMRFGVFFEYINAGR